MILWGSAVVRNPTFRPTFIQAYPSTPPQPCVATFFLGERASRDLLSYRHSMIRTGDDQNRR
jgi:hypothetical protein